MMKQQQNSGQFYILAATLLWGTTGTAQAFAPEGASSLAVGAVRLLLGGVALLGIGVVRGSFQREQRWLQWPTLVAAASMAAYQPAFFAGVARTGVAVGTMVTIGSAPVFAGILGWVFSGKRPSRRWLLATTLAIVGCGFLVLSKGRLAVDWVGFGLSLGAGVAYAVSALASKELLIQYAPDAVTAVIFGLAALLLSPLLFFVDLSWLTQPNGIGVALHLGLMATALAYILYMRGLVTVGVETAVTLALGEPLTATLLGLFLLGEQLTGLSLVGVGLLFAGLSLITFNKTYKK